MSRRRSPEFSICSLANAPPERLAATLAPLRELGGEVVLAVDDRVETAWVEGFRKLADRVILVPFPGLFARLYEWLFGQCSGRWVLQLDADEVPARGLAAEVQATAAAGEVTHGWIPRRWLYPSGETYLAQWPWRPNYSLRLVRNDPALVRFPGEAHLPVVAIGPAGYLREPLYHAPLLLEDLAARWERVSRYEEARPGLVTDGRPYNEAFYLPELRDGVRTAPVPADDAPLVSSFLQAPKAARGPWRPRRRAPVASANAAEIRSVWSRRQLPETAYRARLHLLDDDLRIVVGEERTFDVEVENLGTERWPGGLDAEPRIRLGCGWVAGDGTVVDHGRTPLGGPLAPGGRQIVPLSVRGQERYRTLQVDLVHEAVKWFDVPIRFELTVEEPATGQGAAARRGRTRRLLKRLRRDDSTRAPGKLSSE